MTLEEKQRDLLQQLSACKGAQARMNWLVNLARRQAPLPESFKTEARRVPGCLAKLWLLPLHTQGRCFFQCDSDSQIVKAVAGVLCDFYSGGTPEEILAHPPEFLGGAGITQHLTGNRRNALSRVWETIRAFAEASRTPAP